MEKYYSNLVNKFLIQILSKITGIFPFSLYELSVYCIIISIILFIFYTLFIIFKTPKLLIKFLKSCILNVFSILSIAYFLFIVLWGLNYNRPVLEDTLLKTHTLYNDKKTISLEYNKEDLKSLYKYLITKTNQTRNLTLVDNNNIMKANSDFKNIINRSKLGYDNISDKIPGINGNFAKPKYVISSKIMCYSGITGIYFPFTGEANINIAIPDINIPSTVLHEMAHQRGFANEDEANFIGYLACINHPDIDFNYSGYILALTYTSSALKKIDFESYKSLTSTISKDVINDLKNNSEFWSKYEGKINNLSNKFNNSYLKANGVKEGTQSYGKMVNLLLTYYKLYNYN
ncbi:DUF3810 domain-containing protein [Romboutsia maritimum]|uniref:DUF3810 domain-containing protein n=1 Tax=Romboutsia maritimum TaxID=2020948 RepID=UPI00237AF596|nr:DUF3810 domain-containing protein [Romboutsia maritimum]